MSKVVYAKHIADTRIDIVFSDGTGGALDLAEDIKADPHFLGLSNAELAGVYAEYDTVVFSPRRDLIAPEWYYAKVHGLEPPTTYDEALDNELNVTLRKLYKLGLLVDAAEFKGRAMPELHLERERTDINPLIELRRVLRECGEWNLELRAVRGDISIKLKGVT